MSEKIPKMTAFKSGELEIQEGTKATRLNPLTIDEAIKLIFQSEKAALIKFANSAFQKKYDIETTELVFLNSEFISAEFDKIHADLMFSLNGDQHHLEFQTKYDKTMIVRFFSYGSAKAAEKVTTEGVFEKVVFEFPAPLLIQLEENEQSKNTMMAEIKISGREAKLEFEVPVINMWTHSPSDLIKKQWYLLLPFCLLKYRKWFDSAKGIRAYKGNFIKDIKDIDTIISLLIKHHEISTDLAINLVKTFTLFVTHINNKYLRDEEIQKEVGIVTSKYNPLGSKIMDEVLREGMEKGMEKGMEETLAVIKLLQQNKTIAEISKKLEISDQRVKIIADKFNLS